MCLIWLTGCIFLTWLLFVSVYSFIYNNVKVSELTEHKLLKPSFRLIFVVFCLWFIFKLGQWTRIYVRPLFSRKIVFHSLVKLCHSCVREISKRLYRKIKKIRHISWYTVVNKIHVFFLSLVFSKLVDENCLTYLYSVDKKWFAKQI